MDVCLIVLAGGSGNRMKGYKPIFKIHGKPLIKIILEKIIDVFDEILIVVREEWQKELLIRELDFNVRYVFDIPSLEGPLAAIYAGALNSKYEKIAIVPSDTPFINSSVFIKMSTYLNEDYEAVVPIWPNGYLEPLIAIYLRNPLIEALKKVISENEYRVQLLLKNLKTRYVDVYELALNPEKEFFNINTLEELALAEEIIAKER
ncbi:MAG: molybdenum cofactor guanylyltransferase [Candidatus Methanomethylicia archaeon]|nr:molybdenum cofactor guanylyltransferase [Candidatus Methanomethylicia archaeon]MCX8168899.1 molybdenum cofactor guanylyltransferase [Candidatus Methanomethylicia archaeon]MDW7988631.1 molybdenum cofactor guanylyltransferase [Nitrososphaerota archaeon]